MRGALFDKFDKYRYRITNKVAYRQVQLLTVYIGSKMTLRRLPRY